MQVGTGMHRIDGLRLVELGYTHAHHQNYVYMYVYDSVYM